MIENIANILGFRKIYKPLLTIDDALGNATKPTNELTFLEDYYKALIAEDEKAISSLKKRTSIRPSHYSSSFC